MSSHPAGDYREKAERELEIVSRLPRPQRLPSGDPASGVMLVLEDPVSPRVLDALRRSLAAVELPEAYLTHASSPSLLEELYAVDPSLLVAVGPGAAHGIDRLEYPLVRLRFSEAPEGEPFLWTGGTPGLRLPPLAPALESEPAKRRFWRAFLTLPRLLPEAPRAFRSVT